MFPAEEDDKYELESVCDDEEEGDLGLESTHGGSGSGKEGGFAGFSGKGPRRNSRGDDEERESFSEVSFALTPSNGFDCECECVCNVALYCVHRKE